MLIAKSNVVVNKYKYSLIIGMVFLIISNIRIYLLEDKFRTLYNELNEVEIIGVVTSEGKIGDYNTSYRVRIKSINGDTKYKNTNLIIYLKNGDNLVYGKIIKLKKETKESH